MLVCPDKEKEFYDENGDIDRLAQANFYVDQKNRELELVSKGRRNGYYTAPSERVSGYIDRTKELVGKTLVLEDIDGYSEQRVEIKTAEVVDSSTVRINGKYSVNMDMHMTTDGGSYTSILGSEGSGVSREGTIKMNEISGTVVSEVDGLLKMMEEFDGKPASDHTKGIIEFYKNTLLEAGKDIEITVEVLKDLEESRGAMGDANPATGKITLLKSNTRYNTHAEILAHELQHVMIKEIMKDTRYSRQVMKLRDLVRDEVDYTVFLADKDNATSEDIKYAKDMYEYMFYNQKEDVAADEFLALATTNEKVINALGKVESVKYSILHEFKTDDLDDKGRYKEGPKKGKRATARVMWNKLAKAVNAMYAKTKTGENAAIVAQKLLIKGLELGYRYKNNKDKDTYDRILDKINEYDDKLANLGNDEKKLKGEFLSNLRKEESNYVDKAVDAFWNLRGLAKVKSAILQNNVFSSVTRNMKNEDISKFYEMFKHAKAFVENNVAPHKHAIKSVLDEDYGLKGLSTTQSRAVKRVLVDTDAKVLGDMQNVRDYIADDKKRREEIDRLEKKLGSKISKASESTAKLMVTNEADQDVFVNANQIGFEYVGKSQGPEVADIDRLITLKAIEMSSDVNRSIAVKVLDDKNDDGSYKFRKGIVHAFTLMNSHENKLLNKAYGGDYMYKVKGAKQESLRKNSKNTYYIVNEKEAKELAKAKMYNAGKHEALSEIMAEDMYVMVGEKIEPGYTEGMMSMVQLKNEGESLRKMLSELGMTEEEVKDRIEEIKTTADRTGLVPERDGLGEVYDYKIRLSHDVKTKYIGVDDDLTSTIAETVSSLDHKQEAMANNMKSLRYFKEFHEKYKMNKDFKFIEISEDSKGKFKEYWDIMPFYLKNELKKSHKGKLYVEESMLVDFFGYKDVSVTESALFKNSKKKQLWAKKVEDIVKEISSGWKHSVVAKTAGTVQANMTSNMVVALQHTDSKNPFKYAERFVGIWQDMNEYNKLKNEKERLKIRRDAGEKIEGVDKKIKDIEVRMANNPVHMIMQDGQYSMILEDLNKEWIDDSGIIEEKMNNLMNKIKLSKKEGAVTLKDIADVLYVRKDAAFYDSVMKLTTYSDAINKTIILQDLLGQGKMTKREALDYVDGLHVNYNYLDNRWIKYSNDILILSFTKYFFRVFPALLKMLGKKGLTVFFTESVQELSGIGSVTPWQDVYQPFDAIGRKIGGISDPISLFGLMLTPAAIR
jgi:hypothetical protein